MLLNWFGGPRTGSNAQINSTPHATQNSSNDEIHSTPSDIQTNLNILTPDIRTTSTTQTNSTTRSSRFTLTNEEQDSVLGGSEKITTEQANKILNITNELFKLYLCCPSYDAHELERNLLDLYTKYSKYKFDKSKFEIETNVDSLIRCQLCKGFIQSELFDPHLISCLENHYYKQGLTLPTKRRKEKTNCC